jgi:RNA polymerase sigma-70 factor (ECF subfamily)
MTGPDQGGDFPSTKWTLIARSLDLDSSAVSEAFAWLCQEYWYPLYVYIRRKGHGPEDAQDLTQEFLACLLEKGSLGSVDRSKGKFRAFLLACCKHFLANERDRRNTLKRGGGRAPISIDTHDAERRYLDEPIEAHTPESLFERRWALTLLDHALERLHAEYAAKGNADLYERLRTTLAGEPGAETYARIGEQFGMAEEAVKKAAQRLRARYRDVLREQIASTVNTPEEVEDELLGLRAALRY